MKKNLIVALALVFVLGIAGTAFAAANPFVDVPAKHWAYDAVSKLAKAGILDGYGDGTYRGERLASRYEMAQATAKAMARADKADAQMKALIDKLAVEFAAELNNLGVRVAKLEKNASSIKFTGDARIRYQRTSNAANGSYWNERVRLNLTADVSEKVAFEGRIDAQGWNGTSSDSTNNANDQLEYALMNFKFKNVFEGADFTIGRTSADLLNNQFYSFAFWDAIKADFKIGKVNLLAGYGDARYAPGPNRKDENNRTNDPFGFYAVGAQYKASKEFTFSAAYLGSDSNMATASRFSTWGFGVKYTVPDWFFLGEYTKNTYDYSPTVADPKTDAMIFTLGYKNADRMKPNTWGLYVSWFKRGQQTPDIEKLGGHYFQTPADTSGWAYGLKYTVSKNVVMGVEVQSLKKYDGTDKDNDANNAFQFRTDFWF